MSDDEPRGGAGDLADDPATAALMAAFAPVLADDAVWDEPPPGLEDAIVAAIAAEPAVPAVPPAPARRTRRPRTSWWLAAAAAVIALVAVGVVATRGGDDGGEQLALVGTELAATASADGTVEQMTAGTEVRLDIQGLPPAPDGMYYQAWARSPDGELVSMGTFHMRGGDATITLWSAVSPEDFPIVTVTIQTLGAGAESSGQVVLRGEIQD